MTSATVPTRVGSTSSGTGVAKTVTGSRNVRKKERVYFRRQQSSLRVIMQAVGCGAIEVLIQMGPSKGSCNKTDDAMQDLEGD